MKRLSIVILSSIVIVALAALFLRGWSGVSAATNAHPLHSSSTCGVWKTVASPNVGTSTNFLNGVAAISSTNVWTVGSAGNGNGSLTLVEHWNGMRWKVVASPTITGSISASFSDVAALAANNIWAVGNYINASNTQQTLIEHWNGTSWSIVPNPVLGSGQLSSIAVIASNNIWAVGSTVGTSMNGYQTLIEHWNGTGWSIVPGPGSDSGQLFGVTAIASNNIWAVGNVANTKGIQTLIEHWNGTIWSVVSSFSPGLGSNTLNKIAAISSNNIWAVGDDTNSSGPSATFAPLVEHWNGTTWSIVTSPMQGTSDFLNGIAAVSASNIWAVGDYRSSTDPEGPYFTLIEHWNGTTWKAIKSPSPGSTASDLLAAARVPATRSVWAVGFVQGTTSQTLTEFFC
jgi:hypothetical protein